MLEELFDATGREDRTYESAPSSDLLIEEIDLFTELDGLMVRLNKDEKQQLDPVQKPMRFSDNGTDDFLGRIIRSSEQATRQNLEQAWLATQTDEKPQPKQKHSSPMVAEYFKRYRR